MRLIHQFEGATWEEVLVPAAAACLGAGFNRSRIIRVGHMLVDYERPVFSARVYETESTEEAQQLWQRKTPH